MDEGTSVGKRNSDGTYTHTFTITPTEQTSGFAIDPLSMPLIPRGVLERALTDIMERQILTAFRVPADVIFNTQARYGRSPLEDLMEQETNTQARDVVPTNYKSAVLDKHGKMVKVIE